MKIRKNELLFFVGIIILYLLSIEKESEIFNINDMIGNILLFVAYICIISNRVINKITFKELRHIFF